jgi:beta-lactamase regulating signal transducer with metallopeptidase domain
MMVYLIKSGISLCLMFGLYWFFLRKVKLFIFNRYFLILSVLFSLLIPFITIRVNIAGNEVNKSIVTALYEVSGLDAIRVTPADESSAEIGPSDKSHSQVFSFARIPVLLYFSGLLILLIRFMRNIILIFKKKRTSEKINHGWYEIALLDHPANPYSFLGTVFMNKKDYLENRIPEDLIKHELEHIRQSHSLDVIFFEIIQVFFWFNPMIILFNRAARMNHEYLADNAVVKDHPDRKSYSCELINFLSCKMIVPLTSGFNPSMIRKRLLMLNRNNPKKITNFVRILGTLSYAALLLLLLSFKPVYSEISPLIQKSENEKDFKITYTSAGYILRDTLNRGVILVSSVKVKANGIEIEADSVHIDMKTNTIYAVGKRDSEGKIVEKVILKEGDEAVAVDSLRFDYRTKRVRASNISSFPATDNSNKELVNIEAETSSGTNKSTEDQDAVIATSAMKVLYRGIANPVEIAVPGVPSDNVSVKITNGKIRRAGDKWEVEPGDQPEAVITILVNNKKVSEKRFNVKDLPAPVAVFSGKSTGSISKESVSGTEVLKAEIRDFELDARFEITSFTYLMSTDTADVELKSDGNKFSPEMKAMLAGLRRGQSFILKDIKAIGPDRKVRDLNPLIIKIE